MVDDLSKLNGAVGSVTSLMKQTWFICLLLWIVHFLCVLALFSSVDVVRVRSFVVQDLQFSAFDGVLGWTEQVALPILQRADAHAAVQIVLCLLAAAGAYGYFRDGQRGKPIVERQGAEGEDYGVLVGGVQIMLRSAVAFVLAVTVPTEQRWMTLGITLAVYWVALVCGEWRRSRLSFGDVVQFAIIVALGACVSVLYVPLMPLLVLGNIMSGNRGSAAEARI